MCDGKQTDENSMIFVVAESRSFLPFKCNTVFKSDAIHNDALMSKCFTTIALRFGTSRLYYQI